MAGIDAVFYGASEIDDDFYEELEEILIMGDIGVNATNDIIERMKEEVKKKHSQKPDRRRLHRQSYQPLRGAPTLQAGLLRQRERYPPRQSRLFYLVSLKFPQVIERMKEEVKKKHLRHPSECKELLVESIKEQMRVGETAYDFEKEQSIIFIIGVNGVGKTTSVGKLAGILKKQGKKVLIAAADHKVLLNPFFYHFIYFVFIHTIS